MDATPRYRRGGNRAFVIARFRLRPSLAAISATAVIGAAPAAATAADAIAPTTARISVSSSGGQGNGFSSSPSISADGRYVAFDSDASNLVPGDTNDTMDVFVRGPLH